jgi:hypothetical protein
MDTIIAKLRESVAKKSNLQLQLDCKAWVLREKKSHVAVIIHLAEIAKRGIHLEEGFHNLYNYCRAKLNLSEGEICLRSQVAKACSLFPELLEALISGDLNLSVAGKISGSLTPENKLSLLAQCKGKSKREVEELLALDHPGHLPAPQLRPLTVLLPTSTSMVSDTKPREIAGLTLALQQQQQQQQQQRESAPEPRIPAAEPTTVHLLRCALPDATKKKLLRLAEILGVDNPIEQVADLLDRALDLALYAKDPAMKKERKKPGATVGQNPQAEAILAKPESATDKTDKKLNIRFIPRATKRMVFARANYQCEYTATSGIRCASRTHLEVDHRQALFLGGENEAANMQILCAAHHRKKSEEEFGRKWLGKISMA